MEDEETLGKRLLLILETLDENEFILIVFGYSGSKRSVSDVRRIIIE